MAAVVFSRELVPTWIEGIPAASRIAGAPPWLGLASVLAAYVAPAAWLASPPTRTAIG